MDKFNLNGCYGAEDKSNLKGRVQKDTSQFQLISNTQVC